MDLFALKFFPLTFFPQKTLNAQNMPILHYFEVEVNFFLRAGAINFQNIYIEQKKKKKDFKLASLAS